MIGFLIWVLGLVCCLWCIKDVWKKPNLSAVVKLILIIALLCFSWVGLAVYYFLLKDRL